jgi:glycosyltransferase involved in cell wall biosynthesis
MTPRITVGISVYNAAGTVANAISSVQTQTFVDWELLLIDDGSTDGSAEILASVDDPRVRLYADGVNRGLVHRLNQMVELARAPFFARMDADDLMHPERLARQFACMQDSPGLELCGTAVYVMDEGGAVYGIRGDDPPWSFQGVRSGFIHPTVIGRTEWFRRNAYDAAYVRAEDQELWARADAATPCRLIREPLLFYREPLSPQVPKYRASCRTTRKILRRYGPERLGPTGTGAALLGCYGKELLYAGCAAAGATAWLVRRRNRPCTEEELRTAEAVLSHLRRQASVLVRIPVARQCTK